ncbi:hypothetical protein BC938DRAFT_479201 [Jimgerdemannia flammicorona]|uniref:DUF4112 domain-containing protein n=1 Tax=Jimgerdemannia flammicorona TaxID=994334 RepID=A0A433QLE1_9FUNG|nr:hypothetical protein BC938DRAFT_479201 [Jimgerdemannia flammicorona]
MDTTITRDLFYMRTSARPMDLAEAEDHLARVRTVANWLDRIPGSPVPVGLDSLVGFIPTFGDLAGFAFSMYQVYLTAMFGIPIWLLARMIFYLVIDFFIGLIPALGDVLDCVFTANIYNCNLLEDWLVREKIVRPKAEREKSGRNREGLKARANGRNREGLKAGWW